LTQKTERKKEEEEKANEKLYSTHSRVGISLQSVEENI
jgi:hypothetical protein